MTGTKISHFKSIQHKTKINYNDMLFFDDETRNKEVERYLGVKFTLVVDGVTKPLFDKAIEEWRKHRHSSHSK